MMPAWAKQTRRRLANQSRCFNVRTVIRSFFPSVTAYNDDFLSPHIFVYSYDLCPETRLKCQIETICSIR